MSIKEITGLLAGVGFSSPPSWLRPFRSLSTGEQFRAGLARALAESPALVVVDEFTSSVDRIVARTASAAVAKFARRSKRKLVAVTCHDDVIDWLDPDWILQMPNGEFTRRSLRSRPAIEMEVVRAHRSAWNLFRAHHYLDTELHRSAKCFVAVVFGRPAAFASVIPHPVRGGFCWREHRTVCLPDFQGAGIGNRLSEFVASLMVATGRRFHSTTGNPAMIRHRLGSHLWQMTRKPSLKPYERHEWVKGLACARTRATARITAGFRYVGAPNFNDSARLAIAPFVSSRV
jgi:energy-coupling factor transporter ATP-binding protein EcfA2